ncbi:hypothetical protein U1Q18_045414, partial [Sarracenia purpurea var. burkii]
LVSMGWVFGAAGVGRGKIGIERLIVGGEGMGIEGRLDKELEGMREKDVVGEMGKVGVEDRGDVLWMGAID